MLPIPHPLQERFEKYLQNKNIPNKLLGAYKKWLRYYLDFCGKYNHTSTDKDSLPKFINKLYEKKQTKEQQEEAESAIKIYYRIIEKPVSDNKGSPTQISKSSIVFNPQGRNDFFCP